MLVLPSYRNQSIDFLCKSNDWFLYEATLALNGLNEVNSIHLFEYKRVQNSRTCVSSFNQGSVWWKHIFEWLLQIVTCRKSHFKSAFQKMKYLCWQMIQQMHLSRICYTNILTDWINYMQMEFIFGFLPLRRSFEVLLFSTNKSGG